MLAFLQNIPSIVYTAIALLLSYVVASFFQDKFLLPSKSKNVEKPDPEFVRECAREVVRVGQSDYAEMLESVEDAASYCGLSSCEAAQILDEEISALVLEQETWTEVTEVDRLNAAISELEALGYHTGGGLVDDPGFEVSKARKADKVAKKKNGKIPGYIFYHRDGVEETVTYGHPIYFWCGIPRRKTSQVDKLRVVSDLNAALKANGLRPEWDGTSHSQLSLQINWQVRWDERRIEAA